MNERALEINGKRIEIVQGDITKEKTDAIVNAANDRLMPGGGVCGAIHRAGGPAIEDECRQLGGCETGNAKATTAGELPAKYVIHAVGPVYQGGTQGEAGLLASAYRRSIEVADEKGCESIAFPAISCGIYGYPIEKAATLAIETVKEALQNAKHVQRARFVLFSQSDYAVFENARNA